MSLSLKQQLSNASSALQTQVNTLSTETAEAVAFFHNITSANADIAALESTVSTNASGISTLVSTTTGQTSAIATIVSDVGNNAQSIIDLNTGFTTQLATKQPNLIASSVVDVNSITLNDSQSAGVRKLDYAAIVDIETNVGGIAQNLFDETTRALGVEAGISSSLNDEVIRAGGVEAGLTSALAAEIATRAAVDVSLQSNIDTVEANAIASIGNEQSARIAGDGKMVFCNMMEFEGVLQDGEYNFAGGYGAPSSPGFGLSIPFGFKVVAYSLVCVSSDSNPVLSFELEHYDSGSSTSPSTIGTFSVGATKYINSMVVDVAHTAGGNVCLKVVSASGVVDVNARYRFAVYVQSQVGFS